MLFNVIPLSVAVRKDGEHLLEFNQSTSTYNVPLSNNTVQSLVYGAGLTLIAFSSMLEYYND